LRIACVGGGPAGLYFALLMKLRDPRHDITIFERSPRGATRGWGVVFWRDLLDQLYAADPESALEIERASFPWVDRQVVEVHGEQVVSSAPPGYGIRRQRLVDILVNRALSTGVRIEFEHGVTSASQLPGVDLVVACDGVNSRIRQETGGISTDVHVGGNKYIWLGTDKVFDSFTFPFIQTDSGWIWAHGYGADAESSTFVVECSADTWAGLGFDTMPPEDCLSMLEKIFERQLDGHQLIGQTSGEANAPWGNFRTVTNNAWHHGKTVLAGDAAHTTHFSIGSGTKLAIEDAISLAGNLQRHQRLEPALQAYERERKAAILHSQITARLSSRWLEDVPRYMTPRPRQFATLMHRRRSPLLPHFPPLLYYWLWLYPTSHEPLALRRVRKRAFPKAITFYGKFYGRHTQGSQLCSCASGQDSR
jgi:2-polyprenyl-6-methoxyphenol hydroxylase-like FAD-dependent oxidoreductase